VTQLVLLDCEAVQAIGDRTHRKHESVLARVKRVAVHKQRRELISVAVPAAVRVEAGWDRTSSRWAFANQLEIPEIALVGGQADAAAGIRARTKVSVADAHLGAAIQLADADRVTVITSDPRDIRAVAGDKRTDIIAI
jgi:hypothetical protein